MLLSNCNSLCIVPAPLLHRIGNEAPTNPTEVGARDIDHNSATIEWTMQTLSCAEETFEVQYGDNALDLDNRKSLPSSGADVSQENVQLSVELSELASCTLYYYRVVVTNSAGSSASGVNSFETQNLSGKLQSQKVLTPCILILYALNFCEGLIFVYFVLVHTIYIYTCICSYVL